MDSEPKNNGTWQPIPSRTLYCNECKTWTMHVLSLNKEAYVCSCGTEVKRIQFSLRPDQHGNLGTKA